MMKKTNNLVIAVFTMIFLLSSCDCLQRLQGIVVDDDTGEPIEGVDYFRYTEEEWIPEPDAVQYRLQTDQTGYFTGGRISNGFTCRPRMKMWIGKDGYVPQIIQWKPKQDPNDTLVVRLRKIGEGG